MVARRVKRDGRNGPGRWWTRIWWQRVLVWGAVGVVTTLVLVLAVVYSMFGRYGLTVVRDRGLSTWSATGPDDPRLTPGMRLALSGDAPDGEPGPINWHPAAPGFETAELAVLVGSDEVDRILLSRIDPAHYRFEVLSRPAGDYKLRDWVEATGAALVVNGSYFDPTGGPDTPVVIDGALAGPADYHATHGAFVATARPDGSETAAVVDLIDVTWQDALDTAATGLVSYPLLIGADGTQRASHADPAQLANRSFVASDHDGRIIIGTTIDAFFSLDRLATFLASAPLDIDTALNLDGGPVACQAVHLETTTRDFCGSWETARHGDQVELLGALFNSNDRYGLPITLTVYPAEPGA